MAPSFVSMRSVTVAVLCAISGPPNEAAAHSVAISRQPAPDARLSVPPKRVAIEFNEPVEAEFSEIKVSDRHGDVITRYSGPATCVSKKCTLELPPLLAGTYTVSYSVLSVDGHVVKASYVFSVVGEAP